MISSRHSGEGRNPVSKKCLFAFVMLALCTGANATELGRLFFTPEQRAQLEYEKLQNGEPGESSRVLSVNGIVQKHGGARTVWINGKAQDAGASDEKTPESVPVAVPGQSQPVKVKVGQKILIDPAPTASQ